MNMHGFYIRNMMTGAFVAGDNLQPREFASRNDARYYIKMRGLNKDIYKIGYMSVMGRWIPLT